MSVFAAHEGQHEYGDSMRRQSKGKVSIIIPAYNVEKYIHRAIESCVSQTYSNVEIVIVDDGSSDETWKIITEYGKKDARINAVRQTNKGVSAARNHALELATGEYVIFLDSDDWLDADAVEALLSLRKAAMAGALICTSCYYAYFNPDGSIRRERQENPNEIVSTDNVEALRLFSKGDGLYLNSACYKLFQFETIRNKGLKFDETIANGEDGLFVFSYLNQVDGLYYKPIPLWNILERPGSATTSSYNHKWLSILKAIDEMIEMTSNQEIVCALHALKLKRAVWLGLDMCKCSEDCRDDYNSIRNILRSERSSIKMGMNKLTLQYWLVRMIPYGMARRLVNRL